MGRILMTVLLAAGAGLAETPEEAFDSLVDALYSSDAQGVYSSLSTESAAMLNLMILMVKADPEAAAADISAELDLEITGEELSGWTAMDLVSTVISAPGFTEQLPPRNHIMVTGSETSGDTCLVYFEVQDVTGQFDLMMVRQNGLWKLDQSVIQTEL